MSCSTPQSFYMIQITFKITLEFSPQNCRLFLGQEPIIQKSLQDNMLEIYTVSSTPHGF